MDHDRSSMKYYPRPPGIKRGLHGSGKANRSDFRKRERGF